MVPASHTQYPLQSARVQHRSEASHRLSTSVQDYLFQKTSLVWSYSTCWPGNGSLPCSLCRRQQPSTRLERQRGRPTHTWTRTVEADLKPCNYGLHSAWHRAQGRNAWSRLVQTAMPSLGSGLGTCLVNHSTCSYLRNLQQQSSAVC